MAIKLTPAEAAILESVATDANIGNRDGFQVQPSTPFVAPIVDYAVTVPPASDIEATVLSSFKSMFASYIRRTGPISYNLSNTTPNFIITTTSQTLLTSVDFNLEVPRTVLVSVSGSAYASSINNRLDYWLDLNGSAFTVYKLYFNAATDHRSFCSTWAITIPAGSCTIQVRAACVGAGNIILNNDDFVSLSVNS